MKYNKEPRNHATELRLANLEKFYPAEAALRISIPTAKTILEVIYSDNICELTLNPPNQPRLAVATQFKELSERARYRSDHCIILLKYGTLVNANDLLHEAAHALLWNQEPPIERHGEEFILVYGALFADYLLERLCGHEKGTTFLNVIEALEIAPPAASALTKELIVPA